ncbi:DUF1077-domain-containing protein, partial [Rhizopogon vinicolor AM-OR11-026]
AAAASSYASLKEKRAWDLAIAPAKSLPMQAFMLYMSGGGVQIFSMGIVFMLLLTPFKNIAGMNEAFTPFAPTPASVKSLKVLPLQKIAYIACNLLTLAVGLWKCRSMGLLPTGTGDWLAFETRGMVSSHAVAPPTCVHPNILARHLNCHCCDRWATTMNLEEQLHSVLINPHCVSLTQQNCPELKLSLIRIE